jgi:hypothetical protein
MINPGTKGITPLWVGIAVIFIVAGAFFFWSQSYPQTPPSTNDNRGGGREPPVPPIIPPVPPSVSPPPSTANFLYSYEELKTGQLDGKIIHCSGPLFTPAKHTAYLASFLATKSYAVRSDINLADTRFSPEKKVAAMKEAYNQFPNEIPVVSILYTKSLGNGIGSGLDKEVLDGKYDKDLKLLAEMMKGFNRPVFVRVASEFNGSWSGYHLAYYADSYRYIVDFLKKEGVNKGIFMWNYMPLAQSFAYADWYPGDDYVDWWSVDVFSNHFKQTASNKELKRFLTDAKAHGKPVIIPESGPSENNINDITTWDSWFVPFFELVNDSAYTIKGFCYSNEDFTKTTTLSTWKDVQLPGTPIVPLYAEELKKPQYLNQQIEK